MKRLRITVEGKTYEVTVELPNEAAGSAPVASAAVSAPASSPVSAASALTAAGPGVIVSPLGGNVVGINVKVGQEVKAGEQVATLEAMKMNTFINAPADGKVAEVLVTVGTAVQEGQGLIRIE
ncbi:MAG: biotin/lipoyl-containing protein [Verrucomicrobiota bacterium]